MNFMYNDKIFIFHSAGQPYCCVKFVSLRRGDEVHSVSFSHPVLDIKANERYAVTAIVL